AVLGGGNPTLGGRRVGGVVVGEEHARAVEAGDGRLQLRGITGAEAQRVALGMKAAGDGEADAAIGAGDHHGPAGRRQHSLSGPHAIQPTTLVYGSAGAAARLGRGPCNKVRHRRWHSSRRPWTRSSGARKRRWRRATSARRTGSYARSSRRGSPI